jgi:hypothetical protein
VSDLTWIGCGPSCCRCHCGCPDATEARTAYAERMAALTIEEWDEIRTRARELAALIDGAA